MNHRLPRRWRPLLACPVLSLHLLSAAPAVDHNAFAQQVGVLIKYYQIDQAALRPLLRAYQASPDASDLLENLQQMEDAGEAQMVESSYLVAVDGQGAKINSAREHIYPTEFDPPELPQTLSGPLSGDLDIITPTNPTAFDIRNLGHRLEFAATVSPGGDSVTLDLTLERSQLLGTSKWGEDESMTEQPTFHRMIAQTNMTVKFGGCELFGTFAPPGREGKRVLGLVCPINLAATEKELPPIDNENVSIRQVSLITEYIEVDAGLASKIARELANSADASAIRLRLDETIANGSAKLIDTNTVLTGNGQRSKAESVEEYIYPTEYDPAEIPQSMTGPIDPALDYTTSNGATAFETRKLGTSVDLEAKIGPGGTLIHLNIAPSRVVLVGETNYGIDEARSRQPLFESLTIHSNVAVADGTSLLLGMHSLETARSNLGGTEEERAEVRARRVLVFVTAKIKSVK